MKGAKTIFEVEKRLWIVYTMLKAHLKENSMPEENSRVIAQVHAAWESTHRYASAAKALYGEEEAVKEEEA